MHCKIPHRSKYTYWAAAGRATGCWDCKMNVFTVQLPPGITRANMEFMETPGYYTFDFDTSQCFGSFVGWGDYDYDYESESYQMEREFDRSQQRPHPTNYLYRRINERLDTYNPARPRDLPGMNPTEVYLRHLCCPKTQMDIWAEDLIDMDIEAQVWEGIH